MAEALGDFDPKATYDDASQDYERASARYWQYLSTRTVDRLRLHAGDRVLDVPCGTGPSLVAAAQQVGPDGRVVGIDFAEQMLAIARDKARAHGLDNIDIDIGDMTAIDEPPASFDAVICVLGVFFVDDMPTLARSFYDLVRDGGGRLAITVLGEQFLDPMVNVFVDAVQTVTGGFDVVLPWARTEDESALRGIFDAAGIVDVVIDTDHDTLPLPSGDDWWHVVMGSGLRRTVTAIGSEAAAEVRAVCNEYIATNRVDELMTTSRYAIATRR